MGTCPPARNNMQSTLDLGCYSSEAYKVYNGNTVGAEIISIFLRREKNTIKIGMCSHSIWGYSLVAYRVFCQIWVIGIRVLFVKQPIFSMFNIELFHDLFPNVHWSNQRFKQDANLNRKRQSNLTRKTQVPNWPSEENATKTDNGELGMQMHIWLCYLLKQSSLWEEIWWQICGKKLFLRLFVKVKVGGWHIKRSSGVCMQKEKLWLRDCYHSYYYVAVLIDSPEKNIMMCKLMKN